ncbi:hypothetical protein AMTRI_Chr13g86350 [Amborella trichopoda]
MVLFILFFFFFCCLVRCDFFSLFRGAVHMPLLRYHYFLNVFLGWNSIVFWCDLILFFNDLLLVGNFVDLLFICLLFDCVAISVIFHILGFFYEYFIQFIHDLFIIIAHFFLCTFFKKKNSSMDKLISHLFCSIIFVVNYCYCYVELLWVDSVVQMSGSIEIRSPFVWFSRRNYHLNIILWIRVGFSLPVVDMLALFFGI